MSAISSLPVEIWQFILRYAIQVPRFLDPDAYEGVLSRVLFHARSSPLNDEGTYWRAEKKRNRMQLVSKSWDSFLRRFEHRFIRMVDIRHGKVPLQKLQTAIRVSFGDYYCTCMGICRKPSFIDFILDALARVGNMKAEIVDMPELPLFRHRSVTLENIKVIVSARYMYRYPDSEFYLQGLPSLRHFNGTSTYGIEVEKGPLSSNLVTLGFSIRPGEKYDPIVLDFPYLRHLRINSNADNATVEFTKGAVLNILRLVGSQLRSFHLHHELLDDETLEEVWELCPKLETFHTAFSLVSPPTGHPIHTLHLHYVEQIEGLNPLSEWPNLRRIVLVCAWSEVTLQEKETLGLLRDRLRVEDREGLTLEEYDRSL